MKRSGTVLILLLLLVPVATAASVTISPTTIAPGDIINVNVNDLPENSTFSLGINAEFDATPGEIFSFRASDITLPFSLTNGEVNAYTYGTNWTMLTAKLPDGGSVSLNYSADENGETTISQPRNIPNGTLELVTISGKAAAGSIITRMEINGKKNGPDDGTISFALYGVETCTATVTVLIDGSEILSQKSSPGQNPFIHRRWERRPDPGQSTAAF